MPRKLKARYHLMAQNAVTHARTILKKPSNYPTQAANGEANVLSVSAEAMRHMMRIEFQGCDIKQLVESKCSKPPGLLQPHAPLRWLRCFDVLVDHVHQMNLDPKEKP